MCYERRDPKQAKACFERDQRKVEYIEREAALNRLCQESCEHDFVEDNCHNCHTASLLTYIPSANVAPVVHGRWIPFHSKAAGDIQYCSACDIGCTWRPNYCPNCGARMRGAEDE